MTIPDGLKYAILGDVCNVPAEIAEGRKMANATLDYTASGSF